jgi:hypothetical protein
MTQRERRMLLVVLVLGGIVGLGALFFIFQNATEGFAQQDGRIQALEEEVRKAEKKYDDLRSAQTKVEHWKRISLPPDRATATSRYRFLLQEMCQRHQLHLRQPLAEGGNLRSARSVAGNLAPTVTFPLLLEGTLARLLGFLKEFYSLNLPHLIRDMTIEPQGTGPDARLDIRLTIEALSLPYASNRDFLVAVPDFSMLAIDTFTGMKQGPVGLATARWLLAPVGLHGGGKLAAHKNIDRDYMELVSKNVFVGLSAPPAPSAPTPPPKGDRDVLKYVQLTSITGNFIKTEASLRNRLTGRFTTLRAEGGWDSFTIRDRDDREVLKGKVRHVEGRNVVIQVEDKHYAIYIGQTLQQALEKELTLKELQAFGLATTAAGNP